MGAGEQELDIPLRPQAGGSYVPQVAERKIGGMGLPTSCFCPGSGGGRLA